MHLDGDNRETQLQRAALARILEDDPKPPKKVRPRTQLLREGMNEKTAYFIHEEEEFRAPACV